jgi:hypothetical protein
MTPDEDPAAGPGAVAALPGWCGLPTLPAARATWLCRLLLLLPLGG